MSSGWDDIDPSPGSMIKVRFDENETGWAKYLGRGIAEINNLPLTDKLRFADVVALKKTPYGGGAYEIERVLARRHPNVDVIYYTESKTYYSIRSVVQDLGGTVSGLYGPSKGQSGALMISHNGQIDAWALVLLFNLRPHQPEEVGGYPDGLRAERQGSGGLNIYDAQDHLWVSLWPKALGDPVRWRENIERQVLMALDVEPPEEDPEETSENV